MLSLGSWQTAQSVGSGSPAQIGQNSEPKARPPSVLMQQLADLDFGDISPNPIYSFSTPHTSQDIKKMFEVPDAKR